MADLGLGPYPVQAAAGEAGAGRAVYRDAERLRADHQVGHRRQSVREAVGGNTISVAVDVQLTQAGWLVASSQVHHERSDRNAGLRSSKGKQVGGL